MIRIKFIEMGNRGWAEYDPSTDTYSWDYEGSKDRFISALKVLENGKEFTELTSVEDVEYGEIDGEVIAGNSEVYELKDWDGQMEDLQSMLEFRGAQTWLLYQ